jgi:hypothetical protein
MESAPLLGDRALHVGITPAMGGSMTNPTVVAEPRPLSIRGAAGDTRVTASVERPSREDKQAEGSRRRNVLDAFFATEVGVDGDR